MSELIEEVKRTPMKFRQKAMLVGLGLVILCSGFVLGSSVTFNYLKDRLRPPAPPIRDHVERMVKEYGLDEQQKAQVTSILQEYRQTLIKTWQQSAPIMATARDRLVEQMRSVLTMDQFEEWFSDLKRHEERRRRRMPPEFRRDRDRGERDYDREWRKRGDKPWKDDFNKMQDKGELSRQRYEEIEVQESNGTP